MANVMYLARATHGDMVEQTGTGRTKKVHNCFCVSHHGSLRPSFNEYVRLFWSGLYPKVCFLFLKVFICVHTPRCVYIYTYACASYFCRVKWNLDWDSNHLKHHVLFLVEKWPFHKLNVPLQMTAHTMRGSRLEKLPDKCHPCLISRI